MNLLVLEPTGRQRAVQAKATLHKRKGGRSRSLASKRGVEFHGSEAGFVLRTGLLGRRQLVVTASRNGQDDLIGILTSIRLQHRQQR